MNSKVMDLDLSEIVFSRALSRFLVFEQKEGDDRGLFLSLTYDAPGSLREAGLVKIEPWRDGAPVPYEYTADPGKLEIRTQYGNILMAIQESSVLRVRAQGVSLRLFAKMRMHEGAVDRLNGCCEVSFASIGKILYVPIKGSITFNAKWLLNDMRPDDAEAICAPDGDGVLELAVHEYIANELPRQSYPSVEDCAREAMEDYEAWFKKYGAFSEKCLPTARLAAYTIWVCRQQPHKGNPHSVMKNEMVFRTRTGYGRAYAMDQLLQSMAITDDLETSLYFLKNILPYRLESGQLPNWINDVYGNYDISRAPTFGAVTEVFIKNYGIEALTNEQWEDIFWEFLKCASWWMNNRVSGEIKLMYHFREECGFRGATIFSGGCPVCAPDLMSFMAIFADTLGRIANHINIDEAESWWEYAENVIDSMLCDLWHDTGYASRGAGGLVESGSILNFVPLILGGRVPQETQQCLIDALKWDPLRSNDDGFLFERGRQGIVFNAEQMVILGMLANGEGEDFLKRIVNSILREGIYDTLPRIKTAPGAMWSSESAASTLLLLKAYDVRCEREED